MAFGGWQNAKGNRFYFNLALAQYLKYRDKNVFDRTLEKVFALDANVSDYWLGKGIVEEMEKDTLAALDAYTRAFRLNPELFDSPYYDLLKSKYPVLMGQMPGKVAKELEALLESGYSSILAARLGKVYFLQKRYEEARALFTKVCSELPNLNRPYLYLAKIMMANGDYKQAALLLKKSNFLDPADYLVHAAFGDLHYTKRSGNEREAHSAILSYRMAIGRWLPRTSYNSLKAMVKYVHPFTRSSNYLIESLVVNSRAKLDFKEIFNRLAELYRQIGEEKAAERCLELADEDVMAMKSIDLSF